MKLKIQENSIKIEELVTTLNKEFEEKYQISKRNKNTIVIANGKIYGAIVMIQKNKVFVLTNFTKMIYQIIFMLLVIFLGVLIPLVIYYFVFHKKMKLVENDVSAFIQSTYSTKIINS